MANSIGGNRDDILNSLRQTNDGGYILGGYSYSNISGDKTEGNQDQTLLTTDYWVVKLDEMGNIQWQNTIGGNNDDRLYEISQSIDKGYICGGSSRSNISSDKTENCLGDWDYCIVKLDSLGNIQWQNTIGGSEDDRLYAVSQNIEGDYICGGLSDSDISGDKTENSNGSFDYWIVKLDTSIIEWQKTIGGSNHDVLFAMSIANGGYLCGGVSDSDISGDKTENSLGEEDFWIIKLFPDTITGIPNHQSTINNIQISPNPLTTQSKLTFANPRKEKFLFTLYDITGRQCAASPLERGQGCVISTTSNEITITKGSKPPGVYLFNLTNEKTGERWNGKVVIGD